MNALNPGGLAPDPDILRPEDHVRLTMDFDDDGSFAEAAAPPESSATEQPRARRSHRPDAPPAAVPPQLAGIEVRLSVEVGGLRLSLRELMQVEPGQLFPLDRMTAEPVSVLVNGKPFARGEIVAVGERFGVRLTEICGGAG